MRKIVIVMSYYNRQVQLNRTLDTIKNSTHTNVEIIIIDDCSDSPVKLPCDYKYPIHLLNSCHKEKFWTNTPVIPMNRGFKLAFDLGADIVILQNPENFHVGDCLEHVENHLTDDLYLTYSCFSIPESITALDNVVELFPGYEHAHPYRVSVCGGIGWYNHPDLRPCYLEFFAAITSKNLRLLNGYDERFANGIAYADNDLYRRVKELGLVCSIPVGPYVVHQWHYTNGSENIRQDLYNKNRDLYESLKDSGYRAVHTNTADF